MAEVRSTYKFGLYGRCPVCKEISKEICDGCGAADAFIDSSKTGIVVCSACGLEHSIRCTRPGCGNEVKTLRTPKNDDEKSRIDEFIYRKTNKDLDKRVFVVKESQKATVVKEMKVPVEEILKKKKEEEAVIPIKDDIDFPKIEEPEKTEPKSVFTRQDISKPETAKVPEHEPVKAPEKEAAKAPEPEAPISLKDEAEKIHGTHPTPEEKQELDKIKSFWKAKEMTITEEKKEEERRIVNQFYDEHEDDVLDKKINFENIYNETAFYDCKVCGREEHKIVCDKCGQFNQFSLNYDALSCKCGNDIKVVTCECGAKHGHSDFYLISDGIKWQYSKSKSYYNYRKGRMLVFSTCPTCSVFSVEKCKVCGSKVNFGMPSRHNEVYCKNCGSVNQFICENRKCNDTVKTLKNPNSIEQKLEWLNEVMNFKSRVTSEKVKYSEPGNIKKDPGAIVSKSSEVSLGVESQIDFSNSFIEEFDSKTKEIITSSFISEVENEVNQRKKLKEELNNYNKNQSYAKDAPKQKFGTPVGVKPAIPVIPSADDEEGTGSSVIMFDDSGSGKGKYIIILVIVAAVLAAAWFGWKMMSSKGADVKAPAEVQQTEQSANPVKTYIEEKKSDIDGAKEAVEKVNEATEAQEKAIEGIE